MKLVGARGKHQLTTKQSFQLLLGDMGQSVTEGQGYGGWDGLGRPFWRGDMGVELACKGQGEKCFKPEEWQVQRP